MCVHWDIHLLLPLIQIHKNSNKLPPSYSLTLPKIPTLLHHPSFLPCLPRLLPSSLTFPLVSGHIELINKVIRISRVVLGDVVFWSGVGWSGGGDATISEKLKRRHCIFRGKKTIYIPNTTYLSPGEYAIVE